MGKEGLKEGDREKARRSGEGRRGAGGVWEGGKGDSGDGWGSTLRVKDGGG